MKKIFILVFLVFIANLISGQLIQKRNFYGESFNRTGADSLLFIPGDTLAIPIAYSGKYFLARKGSNLYGYDTTLNYWISLGGGGSWGSITGTLSDQTDLQTALNARWNILGNSGLSAANNFLGTTDDIPLNFRVNNIRAGRVESATLVAPNYANTSLGYNAAQALTTGSYNTALGANALRYAQTAYQNVAIGVNTLLWAGSSSLGVTAIGFGSMAGTSYNAFANTGVGSYSLTANSTGRDNTAVGYQAMGANLTGGYNVGIGSQVMQSQTTGSYNVGVGIGASNGNQTGSYNTALGNGALNASAVASSSYNIALGYTAGKYNTTEDNQVFINSLDRTNYLGDTTKSPIWIKQHATVASQRLKFNGKMQGSIYGLGNITGTPAYTLNVDASGNIIEGAVATAIDTSGKWIWQNYGTTQQYALKQPANAFFDSLKIRKIRIGTEDSAFRDNISWNNDNSGAYFTGKTLTVRDIDTTTNENDAWLYAINSNVLLERITRLPTVGATQYRGNVVSAQQYEADDTATINSVGGDLGFSLQGRTTVANKFGYSGRSIIKGGVAAYAAVPSLIGTLESSRKIGTTGSTRASGFWAGVTSYHNFLAADTVDNFIAFLATGYSTGARLGTYTGLHISPPSISSVGVGYGVYSSSSLLPSVFGATVGIGTSTLTGTPYGFGTYGAPTFKSTALLQLNSTSQGFITSRMTASQRAAIASPDTALFVYDSDSSRPFIYNNSAWKGLAYTSDITGGTPAGNFGNIQLNRNSAFATPASDSLDFESATGLTVKGAVNSTSNNITGTGGVGYLTMVGQSSNPSSPAAGTLLLHSSTANGFTRMEQDNEATTNLIYGRDNVFIGRNTSGGTLSKGKVVYVTGSTGNVPNLALARANSLTTLPSLSIVVDDILNNAFGQVMILGIISGINTSSFTSGDQVYVSTSSAGDLQNTRPSGTSAAYVQRVGSVLVSGVGNGSLMVSIAPFIGNIESGTTAATWTGTSLVANGSVKINKDSVQITTGKKWFLKIDTATNKIVRDSTTAAGGGSGTIILTSAQGWPSNTSGSSLPEQNEASTNKVNYYSTSFINSSQTYSEWGTVLPADYNGGTITATFTWAAVSASTNSVVWGLAGRAYGDNSAIDQAYGTAVEVTDANNATGTINVTSATSAITIAGTPAAGNHVQFRAYRLGSGADNLAVPGLLLSIKLTYTKS